METISTTKMVNVDLFVVLNIHTINRADSQNYNNH
jgi:hypothetical protein